MKFPEYVLKLKLDHLKWSQIKVSRSCVRASNSSENEHIKPEQSLSFDCWVKNGPVSQAQLVLKLLHMCLLGS